MGRFIHRLKTESPYFAAVAEGRKTFEVRRDDRGFAVGDVLELVEVVISHETGRREFREVTYILPGGQFGFADGWVVMGLKR